MKTRVLELLIEPKNIQNDDLQILKDQIQEFPYLQNVRALHLYGVHLYEPENYQKELSKTAAYTTDKKNLYHLINGNLELKKADVPQSEVAKITENKKNYPSYIPKNGGFPLKRPEEKQQLEAEESPYTAVQPLPEPSNTTVEVEGQRNRILFEGEENFLNEENTVKIDLQSSMESGNLVTEKLNASSETKSKPVDFTSTENHAQNRIADVNPEIRETESDNSSEKMVSAANETAMKTQEIAAVESEAGEAEEEKINFNQSEIKVSPNHNLEQAVEAIVEDQAISFQEISPLEIETEADVKDEDLSLEVVQNQTEFSTETIISEDKMESEDEKHKIEDDSQLSFHGTESFLPEIKIESKSPIQNEMPGQNSSSKNKYEEEMRRLIAQVELKMKEAKKDSVNKNKVVEREEETATSEISFAETQSFNVETQSAEVVENVEETTVNNNEDSADDEKKPSQTEAVSQSYETESDAQTAPSPSWKPMSFETNTLDYSIGKKDEAVERKPAEKPEAVNEEPTSETDVDEETDIVEENKLQQETSETLKNIGETSKEDEKNTPAFNVSFFGNNISSFIKSNQKEESNQQSDEKAQPKAASKPQIKPDQREIPSILDSNVPGFINTWQSWLKIDRKVEVEKEKVEIKEKAIEAFIENNPKISQLKDESSFVIKERTDDISHLMTETLAKLYTEQKLYSKAIQAYHILIRKHPERQSHFEEKIQQIKDSRGR